MEPESVDNLNEENILSKYQYLESLLKSYSSTYDKKSISLNEYFIHLHRVVFKYQNKSNKSDVEMTEIFFQLLIKNSLKLDINSILFKSLSYFIQNGFDLFINVLKSDKVTTKKEFNNLLLGVLDTVEIGKKFKIFEGEIENKLSIKEFKKAMTKLKFKNKIMCFIMFFFRKFIEEEKDPILLEEIKKYIEEKNISSFYQKLDKEIISIIAEEFGKKVTFEEVKINVEEDSSEDNRKFKKRNPIVTIMGHVDHGKTTLLDYIRKSNVAKYEKGGITQHIGAYKITTKNNIGIVFVDTPGHEAFTAMRSRGCDITDIIVIIIAADDGVKPQTEEALNQAKSSGKPIIFAINKIDKEGANIEKVKEDLAKLNFLVEDWGGKYQCQGISAKTGQGVEELLEKINLEAELMELKAHFEGKAKGVVLESSLEKGKGYINNLLIQDGELKLGDIVLAGNSYGKVKSIINDNGQTTKYAYPSDPVRVVGLNSAARSGEKFFVIEDEKKAKMLAEEKIRILREQTIHTQNRITLKDLEERAKKGEYNNIPYDEVYDYKNKIDEVIDDSICELDRPRGGFKKNEYIAK